MPQPTRRCPFDQQWLHAKAALDRSRTEGAWPGEHAVYRNSWICISCGYCEPDEPARLVIWGWLLPCYHRLAAADDFRRLEPAAQWRVLQHAVERLEPQRVAALERLADDAAARAEILSWLERGRRA